MTIQINLVVGNTFPEQETLLSTLAEEYRRRWWGVRGPEATGPLRVDVFCDHHVPL